MSVLNVQTAVDSVLGSLTQWDVEGCMAHVKGQVLGSFTHEGSEGGMECEHDEQKPKTKCDNMKNSGFSSCCWSVDRV